MESLRKPFFVAALILLGLMVLVELGSLPFIHRPTLPSSGSALNLNDIKNSLRQAEQYLPAKQQQQLDAAIDKLNLNDLSQAVNQAQNQGRPPGLGVPYLALLHGMLLFTLGLMAAGMFYKERIQARVQGIATFVFALCMLLLSIGLLILAIVSTLTMIALLLSIFIGTIIYLIIFGSFARGASLAALGILMVLQIGFGTCLVLAEHRFLQNKGLVLLFATSVVANIIVAILQGLVPGILVSITDGIAGIVVAIIAIIWSIVFLIGAIPGIILALRMRREEVPA
jgi:hypothetical protein